MLGVIGLNDCVSSNTFAAICCSPVQSSLSGRITYAPFRFVS